MNLAQRMKQKTYVKALTNINYEYKSVLREIESAADNGLYTAEFSFSPEEYLPIYKHVASQLRADGFEVNHDTFNPEKLCINWISV